MQLYNELVLFAEVEAIVVSRRVEMKLLTSEGNYSETLGFSQAMSTPDRPPPSTSLHYLSDFSLAVT